MRPTSESRGFTLLELMVALAIFALLAAMAYGGLATVLDTRSETDAQAARLAALQTTLSVMERDLEQAVQRPIRDGLGDRQPALVGVQMGPIRLEFTHDGHANPAHLARSNLERVGYGVDDHVLYRMAWRVLDRAQDSQPGKMRLLEHVQSLDIRYLDNKNQWHTSWPDLAPGTPDAAAQAALPIAVEISLDLDTWGRINRVFALPAS